MKKPRIATFAPVESFAPNPFDNLSAEGLKEAPFPQKGIGTPIIKQPKRGRLDIRREKAGRAGKTVTTISGVEAIPASESEALLKRIKNECGTGGALKDGQFVIQGDHRDSLEAFLKQEGYQPVRTGG